MDLYTRQNTRPFVERLANYRADYATLITCTSPSRANRLMCQRAIGVHLHSETHNFHYPILLAGTLPALRTGIALPQFKG